MTAKNYIFVKNNHTKRFAFASHYSSNMDLSYPYLWEISFKKRKHMNHIIDGSDSYDIILTFGDNSYLYFSNASIQKYDSSLQYTVMTFRQKDMYFGSNFVTPDYL